MNARRTRRSMGGGTPANNISLGASAAVRPGRSPGEDVSSGATLSKSPGRSPGQEVSNGATLARRMSTGGYLGPGDPAGLKRLALSQERNVKLGVPHYARGGHAHGNKLHHSLHSIYKILHSHFEGGSEPETAVKKKAGGKMWIKDAINPSNKGALHRSLHVPKGQKIPLDKLHKAEHSKSPTLRKRAQLAETLRGFHRPRGR